MAKTKNSDRKTRAGTTGAALKNGNLVILAPDELKTLINLVDAGIEAGITGRFTKELQRIRGKLRRGF